MKNNDNFNVDEFRGLMLELFNHANETMLNEENAAEALQITRLYFGENSERNGYGFVVMTGFLMGVNEGMRLADVLNAPAADKAAQ